MCKRLMSLVSFVLVLALVGDAVGAAVTWTDAGPDHLWSTAANWDTGTLPTSADKAKIPKLPGPTIRYPGAVADNVPVGAGSSTGALTVDGGTLTTTTWLILSYSSGGSGTLYMNSGNITVGNNFFVGFEGSGTLNMTGGTITVMNSFAIPSKAAGTGHVNLDGGTITTAGFSMRAEAGAVGTMDITAGTLIIDGDVRTTVQGYIDNGWMTAFGSSGTVRAMYDAASNKTTIIGVPAPPEGASAFDVNLDGFDDLIHVNCEDDVFSVELLLSDGGVFSNQILSGSAVNHASEDKWFSGDFNGDGAMDVARLWGGADGKAYCEVETTLQDGLLDLVSWAAAQGDFSASQRWFRGDFNGDGMDDLLEMPYNGTTLSLNVYRSTGTTFLRSPWWSSGSSRAQGDWFFVTDCTGDGAADLVRVYESGGNTACRVYAVNGAGNAFEQSDWNPAGHAYVPDHRWYPGDYNGDGRMDFSVLRSEAGEVRVDMLLSTGSGFSVETNWVSGGTPYTYGDEMWYPGDFNGDGSADLVRIYDEDGLLSADVFVSSGSGLVGTTWISAQGAYQDEADVFLSDVDGDDKQDIVCLKRMNYQSVIGVYTSTGTGFVHHPSAYSQLNRFDSLRGGPVIRRHKYFDPHGIKGPLPADGGDYDAVCRSGQDIYLTQGVQYVHTDATTSWFRARTPQQVFETFEAKTLNQFAYIVRHSMTSHRLLALAGQSSTLAQKIIGDGRRYYVTTADLTSGFAKGGGHFFGGRNASHHRFNRIYALNSVGQTAFKIQEANDAYKNVHKGNRIENCLVFGAGVDARGNGSNPDLLGGWADAIGLTSRETVIRNNIVIDGTDVVTSQ